MQLTAPTDGAKVTVKKIDVLGTIEPRNAAVRVSGKRVRVVGGVFKRSLSLRKGLTHIRIRATAKGFVGSSMVVSVHYAPRRSGPRPSSVPTVGIGTGLLSHVPSSTPASGSGSPGSGGRSAFEAAFVKGCSTASGGNTSVCTCIFDRITKAGFTPAKFIALAERWRRSLLAHGEITYPPAVKQAIVACAAQSPGTGG